MTYTLFEFIKEKFEDLILEQNENNDIPHIEAVTIEDNEEKDAEQVCKIFCNIL